MPNRAISINFCCETVKLNLQATDVTTINDSEKQIVNPDIIEYIEKMINSAKVKKASIITDECNPYVESLYINFSHPLQRFGICEDYIILDIIK